LVAFGVLKEDFGKPTELLKPLLDIWVAQNKIQAMN
jgi:hypothetical protein